MLGKGKGGGVDDVLPFVALPSSLHCNARLCCLPASRAEVGLGEAEAGSGRRRYAVRLRTRNVALSVRCAFCVSCRRLFMHTSSSLCLKLTKRLTKRLEVDETSYVCMFARACEKSLHYFCCS